MKDSLSLSRPPASSEANPRRVPGKIGLNEGAGLRSRRSSALLLVLGMIVLLSALVLAFLGSVSTELTTSQTYANGATVKQLADSAVQVAISQIVSATGNTNSTLAWASQPGMIRTYDTSGKPALYYKLYSSASMITNGAAFSTAAEAPPVDWDSANNAGLYTDLNSSVTSGGTNYFPIIDPRALSTNAAGSIEGFNYTSAVDQVALPSAGPANQRLPMPVLWLYVLQNGALATPLSGQGGKVTFDTSDPTKVPSATNSIVGRVSFWTDDETCKVNINTASEGTFWDRPWANTTTEQNFSTAIPVQNEFQRYPGHPAKTSLSSVFGPLGFPSPWPNSAWYLGNASQATSTSELAAYYGFTPRIADGGTEGGSVNEVSGSIAPNGITLDGDRLYASTDEMLYNPARTANIQNGISMSNAVLEKAKFFITAHSRAPELNLFGKPRMTLWPLQLDTTKRNAKDALIAFCSTIGGEPYYFQRSTTYTAPATPGGGSPNSSSQSATLDWTGVQRNQDLYSYLDQVTQLPIPGFGGGFSSKYTTNVRRQILTEMFDMIRSGVNAYSTALSPQYNYAPSYLDSGEGQVVPLAPASGIASGTHGFGRFITLSGAAIVFYRSNAAIYTQTGGSTGPVKIDPSQVTPTNPDGVVVSPAQIGATLILNPVTISPGFPPWSPNVQYVVTGLDKFKINSAHMVGGPLSLGFTSPLKNTVTSRADYSGTANCSAFFNIVPSFRYSGGPSGDTKKSLGITDPIKQYPFTVPITLTGGVQIGSVGGLSDTTFDFNADSPSGHSITIQIFSGSDGSPTSTAVPGTTPIQTITINFPKIVGLPIPTTTPATTDTGFGTYQYFSRANDGGPNTLLTKFWRTQGLVYYNAASINVGTHPYWVQDVVRGVEADATGPAQGDFRIYAALNSVPANYFTTSPGYDSATPPGGTPTGGMQKYSNAQTLRDQGITNDGGPASFGWDASVPGGYYPHYPIFGGGSANSKNQQLISSFTAGTLLPRSSLATYGGPTGQDSPAPAGPQEYRSSAHPDVPSNLTQAQLSSGLPGDWDNTPGLLEDGPFINKPDEGNSSTVSVTASKSNLNVYYGGTDINGGYFTPGYGASEYKQDAGTTFSPNRQISSAVMFGSLPTGIDPTGGTAPQPWQTLLFCANPAAGANHPGFGTPSSGPPYTKPPDHLLLDLFTMPVVEPYAISEPLSTAGKINMNYQILPFTYITRDTGVRAVLKATRIMAIPQSVSTVTSSGGPSYKDAQRCQYEMRYNINPDETVGTLAGFQSRFDENDIFRSASEICGIYLVPQLIPNLSTGMSYPPGSTPPSSYAGTAAWWNNFLLTGDNTREFPYGDLYARLTTKSNSYTVHVRVQTLKKIIGTPVDQWVEGKDLVTGEYRGSSQVERYVDTSDTTLPDFTTATAPSVEGYYKMRIVSSKKFEP